MADIAVVHSNLMIKGGTEAVCVGFLDALDDAHDVTLLTLSEPSIEELNDYFPHQLEDVDVRSFEPLGAITYRLNFLFSRFVGRTNLGLYLDLAVLNVLARRHQSEFDLMISTKNEMAFSTETMNYVHYPLRKRSMIHGVEREHEDCKWIERVFLSAAGITPSRVSESTILTNSNWTAERVEDVYDTEANVVYPPVAAGGSTDTDWEDRELGLVSVGRIGPEKRQLEIIDIVQRLRDRGHDLHLHIVGPFHDQQYYDRVEEKCDGREHLQIDGELSQREMYDTISDHKYAISLMENEHFGIAAAEMVACGAVTFVHDSGGQREIVDDHDALTFDGVDEAVERIDSVVSDPELEAEVRSVVDGATDRFSVDRFDERVNRIVESVLEGTS